MPDVLVVVNTVEVVEDGIVVVYEVSENVVPLVAVVDVVETSLVVVSEGPVPAV